MSNDYSLTFENKSKNHGHACIFQTCDNFGPDIISLAWFSKSVNPGTKAEFKWTLDYNFIWCESGNLDSKIIYEAKEVKDADLKDKNAITLDYINEAYGFKDLTVDKSQSTSFVIRETENVPLNKAKVGIGMSGSPTFVKDAQPNEILRFTPHPKYWIIFGDYEKGQVIDITQMTKAKEIVYDPGVTSISATLNLDNTFTIG